MLNLHCFIVKADGKDFFLIINIVIQSKTSKSYFLLPYLQTAVLWRQF